MKSSLIALGALAAHAAAAGGDYDWDHKRPTLTFKHPTHDLPSPTWTRRTKPPKWTTSTVYSTTTSTITSCEPVQTKCPPHSTVLTTVIIPVSTTICPVTETEAETETAKETETKTKQETETETEAPTTPTASEVLPPPTTLTRSKTSTVDEPSHPPPPPPIIPSASPPTTSSADAPPDTTEQPTLTISIEITDLVAPTTRPAPAATAGAPAVRNSNAQRACGALAAIAVAAALL